MTTPASDPAAPSRVDSKLTPAVRELLAQEPATTRRLWIFLSEDQLSATLGQLEEIKATLRSLGAAPRWRSVWLNALSLEVPVSKAPRLASLPFVTRVQLVNRARRVRPVEDLGLMTMSAGEAYSLDAISDPYGDSRNQVEQIGVTELHEMGYSGTGVRIAVLDSGFRTDHPALRSLPVIAERDFVYLDDNVDNELGDAASAWDHGTAVWSNIAGYDPGNFLGPAYGAEFLLAKTEDIRAEYPFEEDNYIAGLEWAESMGAHVATASLAYLIFDGEVGYGQVDLDGDTIPVTQAVDIAVSRGMVVLNAAGNSGPGSTTLWAPADAHRVISVGAVDSTGTIMSWSSRGPTADGRIKPEVMARGWRNLAARAEANEYYYVAGTSLAAPLIAGAAALLLEAHPGWGPDRVRESLMQTASLAAGPNNDYGYGIADAAAASALEPMDPPRRPLPFVLLEPSPGETLSTRSPRFRWTRAVSPRGGPSYEIAFSQAPDLWAPDTHWVGTDTTWLADESVFPFSGDWYWTVTATDPGGGARRPFFSSSFCIPFDTPAPKKEAPATSAPTVTISPNPAGPNRLFRCELPSSSSTRVSAGRVELTIHDVSGRVVRHLMQGAWESGVTTLQVSWDGTGDSGSRVSPGIYFVRLHTVAGSAMARMVVLP